MPGARLLNCTEINTYRVMGSHLPGIKYHSFSFVNVKNQVVAVTLKKLLLRGSPEGSRP